MTNLDANSFRSDAFDLSYVSAAAELHDNILFYLVMILFAVGWILVSLARTYINLGSLVPHKNVSYGTLIELIWTITPTLILMFIAFPSFKLLYLMDEVSDPSMAVLAEGHQWYWSYQYPNFLNGDDEFIEFDSYLIPEFDTDIENIIYTMDIPGMLNPEGVTPEEIANTDSAIDILEMQKEWADNGEARAKSRTIYSPRWKLNSPNLELTTKQVKNLSKIVRENPNNRYKLHVRDVFSRAKAPRIIDSVTGSIVKPNRNFIDFIRNNRR